MYITMRQLGNKNISGFTTQGKLFTRLSSVKPDTREGLPRNLQWGVNHANETWEGERKICQRKCPRKGKRSSRWPGCTRTDDYEIELVELQITRVDHAWSKIREEGPMRSLRKQESETLEKAKRQSMGNDK